jgi:hypothetical protein
MPMPRHAGAMYNAARTATKQGELIMWVDDKDRLVIRWFLGKTPQMRIPPNSKGIVYAETPLPEEVIKIERSEGEAAYWGMTFGLRCQGLLYQATEGGGLEKYQPMDPKMEGGKDQPERLPGSLGSGSFTPPT